MSAMINDDLAAWRHPHRFESGVEAAAERRTRIVVVLTVVMMVAEITAGTMFNSMALLADGWHMSTHAGALGIAAFAYGFARRHADDGRFAFGTGKVGALAGFTSAIILSIVALLMLWESVGRLMATQDIAFDEALVVAALGLAVNLVSAWILGGHGQDDHHDHDRDDHPHEHHDHHDHNLRAAYVHVLADALTSVLAIVALLLGKYLGWWWMDPAMGCVGALVIANWSWTLIRRTGSILVDHDDGGGLDKVVRRAIEADGDNRLSDLHLWRIGPGHWAAIVAVVTAQPRDADHYRALLAGIEGLSHVTVEVQRCLTGADDGRA